MRTEPTAAECRAAIALGNALLDLLVAVHDGAEAANIATRPTQTPAKSDGLLVTRERAAELLACSTSMIDAMRRSGELAAVYLGAAPRFRTDELKRLIEAKKAPDQAPLQEDNRIRAESADGSNPTTTNVEGGTA